MAQTPRLRPRDYLFTLSTIGGLFWIIVALFLITQGLWEAVFLFVCGIVLIAAGILMVKAWGPLQPSRDED